MVKKSGTALLFTVTSALVLSLLAPATAANLDDGYPQDTAAQLLLPIFKSLTPICCPRHHLQK